MTAVRFVIMITVGCALACAPLPRVAEILENLATLYRKTDRDALADEAEARATRIRAAARAPR